MSVLCVVCFVCARVCGVRVRVRACMFMYLCLCVRLCCERSCGCVCVSVCAFYTWSVCGVFCMFVPLQ